MNGFILLTYSLLSLLLDYFLLSLHGRSSVWIIVEDVQGDFVESIDADADAGRI